MIKNSNIVEIHFLYKIIWVYLLFVGVHGPDLWGMDNKKYNALFVSLMLTVFLIDGKKRFFKLKPLIWVIVVVCVTFLWKALILKSSGAFVYSIPLLGAPFALLAYSDYLSTMNKRKWNAMAEPLFWFFVVEVGLAIVERIIGYTVFGLGKDETQADILERGIYRFRSTSLWGHPLGNALIVSTIMSFVLVSPFKLKYKFFFWTIGYISILCFNTRGSIIGNALILLVYVFYIFFISKRIKSNTRIIILITGFIIGFIVLILLLTTGLGGRLTQGTLDDASVQTRINIWNVFQVMTQHDLLYGTDNEGIVTIMISAGLYALENFWIILILRFGIIFLVIYTLCYAFLFKKLFMGYKLFDKSIIIGTFVLIASTNNSLADHFMPIFIFIVCSYIFKPKYFLKYVPPKWIEKGQIKLIIH